METELKNKTIVVTGAAGGIGMATAKILAKEGANVVIHYRTGKTKALQLHGELVNMGTDPMHYSADLGNEDEVVSMFSAIKKKYGRIDGLVNNAGIWPEKDTPIYDMEFSQWNKTINVNLSSIFLSTREFLRNIQEFKDDFASVVFVGSTAGVYGEAGHIDYSASKAAIHGFMLSIKNEIVKLARFGRSNIVSPGWTMTPMAVDGLKDKASVTRVIQTTALRKIARAEDIANTIVMLLSDKLSAHTTGQNIVLAGGMEGRLLYEKNEVDPDRVIIYNTD